LIFVDRRVIDFEEKVPSMSFILRHIQVILLIMDEEGVADLGYWFGLFFFSELLSEVRR